METASAIEPRAWMQDLLASLGRAAASSQHALQIIGHDPVIATTFRAGEAAAAVLAANATAAADLWCARGARSSRPGNRRSLSSARQPMGPSARRIQFARRHTRPLELR